MNFLSNAKKLLLIVISLIINVSGWTDVYAENHNFIKNDSYARAAIIEHPENSPLAESFLRNGISIYSEPHNSAFSFKTTNEGDNFIVFIYYTPTYGFKSTKNYVGKYVYTKKKSNENNTEFINSFVKWLLENAWGNR